MHVCLEDLELKSLVDFISNSFYRDESGSILKLNHGIYGDSQFYKAKRIFIFLIHATNGLLMD